MGKKKKVPGINASSTADISFILLIFFLVTTSMDTDMGLGRTLPKPPEDETVKKEMDIKSRNLLKIKVNKGNDVLFMRDDEPALEIATVFDEKLGVRVIPKKYADIIKEKTKEFIANKEAKEGLPEVEVKKIDLMGNMPVTVNHVISVQTDVQTHYVVYFQLQDILVAAYNELRDELSKEKFGYTFEHLQPEQQEAVRQVYPQRISEAEPKNKAI